MSADLRSQATDEERARLLDACVRAAREAAVVIRDHAGNAASLEWEEKGRADFVSEVDTEAEARVRATLHEAFPAAAFVGEESSPGAETGGPLTFVVDPLDGTTNFLHSYPEYAVSVAAVAAGLPAAAVVLNVPTGELFTAVAGGGAKRNGNEMRVSSIGRPPRALIGTGFPFKQPHHQERYQRQFAAVMRETAGIRRAGSAALDLADVACGRFDAFWELTLAPWDFAAGLLLVREAGGRVTDLEGREPPLRPSAIVAGNPTMHAWLLRTLQDTTLV